MSVEISSLEFTPRGDTGWTTGRFEFGQAINVLLGPNGAGKTPTIKGIPFALGHPIELPVDIRDRCSSVILTLKDGQKEYRIQRLTSPGFLVRVVSPVGQPTEITNEKEFSAWLVSVLGLGERNFAAKDGTVAPPYSSTFLPMFWVDQDLGWKALYMTICTGGFSRLVAFTTAPIATGWNESCRAGFAPAERPCLCTAHKKSYVIGAFRSRTFRFAKDVFLGCLKHLTTINR